MTVTRFLYFLVSYDVLWSVIQGNQPDGYLGCFEDSGGDSLVNPQYIHYIYNKAEDCKARCKTLKKRYAGTQNWWCYCGSDFVRNRLSIPTECNVRCPGNARETCGGGYYDDYYYYYYYRYHRISLYDTLRLQSSIFIYCKDINADNYICSCSVGLTGRVGNETVTTTTNTTHFPSSITQATGSSTAAQRDATTTTIIFSSSSTQPLGSSTAAPQPEGNKLAVYIAVPVSIVVIIVFILIVAVLILRKKLNQKKDSKLAVYQNSANTRHSVFTVVNNAYNDHDIIPLETPATEISTADAAMGDSEHSYYTLEQTGNGKRNYNNAGSGSAIQNDDIGYGHLHVRTTAFCDPTYSHTTMTGSQDTTDNMYSHMDQSVGNKSNEIMGKVDQETYNTCNMKGDVGKLRPAVELNDTDDTYNRLAISGKAKNLGDKHTVSSMNEPEYDHTDVRKY